VAAAALATAGVGVTASPAFATTECQGFYESYNYYNSLGLTNYSLGQYDYALGDYTDATYYFGRANDYYGVAGQMLDQYNKCHMEAP
jgi:TolA-binding protein